MLRQALRQRKNINYKSKLYSMQIYVHGETSIICKHCGFFLAPFGAFSHYLNIDIPHYRFGNHFLVTDHYEYQYMQVEHEDQIFNTEQPFLLLYLKPVHCDYCHQNIGLYFQTTNILGTDWLLDRIILNMEKLRLGDNKQASMERTIDRLFALLTELEIEKEENKISFKLEKEKKEERQTKIRFIEKERQLQKLLLRYTDPILPQNKRKGELLRAIFPRLTFFDRRTERLEQECKKLIRKSDALKLKIMNRFSIIQDFKRKMLKLKGSSDVLESKL